MEGEGERDNDAGAISEVLLHGMTEGLGNMTASEAGWSTQGVDTEDCFRASAPETKKRRTTEGREPGKGHGKL